MIKRWKAGLNAVRISEISVRIMIVSILGVVCVLKELYPDSEDWNQGVASRVKELMNAYQGVIERKHIGFPDDWEIRIQKDNC